MTCFVIRTDPLLTHDQFFSESTGFKDKILTLPMFYKALYDPVANTFSLLPIELWKVPLSLCIIANTFLSKNLHLYYFLFVIIN